MYNLNEEFFDIIDTEEKAYALGIWYADGYNDEKRGIVRLKLHKQDIDILHKLKSAMEYEGPVLWEYYKDGRSFPKLAISRKRLSVALSNVGCPQAKTFIIKFPSSDIVPEYLVRHFVRGYFDGDGSISYTDDNKLPVPDIYFTSSDEFIYGLSLLLHDLNIGFNTRAHMTSKGISQLHLRGNRRAVKLLDWLYQDSSIYLDRKFNKYKCYRKLIVDRLRYKACSVHYQGGN